MANSTPEAIASITVVYVAEPRRSFGKCRDFGLELEVRLDGRTRKDYEVLKRYRSMPSFLIRDSRVCLGRPSFAAAPVAPPMTPWASRSASSMIAFSRWA